MAIKKLVIDKSDEKRIEELKLCIAGEGKFQYVGFWSRSAGKRVFIYLHRYLIDAPKGMDVDHINHNTFDNRKQNLRICTRSENLQNGSKHSDAKHSKVLGVCYRRNGRSWLYQKMKNGVKLTRYFKTKEEAEKYAKSI